MLNNITGFHIEPTNICTLKCSGCARTRFIDRWPQHWKNHSLDIDVLLRFLDIDLNSKRINLCGNYGDPIYHPDFIDFVAKLKKAGSVLTITTNGSYRTQDWWNQLTDYLDDNDTIRFSIDGVPENFTEYRKNADWDSIQLAIKICASSRCKTVWKYIPFHYNQYHIEQAKDLSKDLGMDEFLLDPSDRFDEQTINFLPQSTDLVGSRIEPQVNWKTQNRIANIDPKCKDGRQHFVAATGHYSPCCFANDHRFYYKTQFGKNKKNYDINKITLTQLLSDPSVIEFYDRLQDHAVCQYSCPKTESIV